MPNDIGTYNLYDVMVQSVNVRIGDIFCAEIEGWFKRFFQFVGKDVENLNSAVIRVFERTYPMEEQPDVAQILDDRTEFYTHTFVQPGLKARAWYKVGHAKETGEKELRHVLFANFIDRELLSERKLDAHIEGIWRCWHFGEEAKEYAKPPLKKEEQLEGGAVYSYVYILPRLKYGIFPRYEPIDKFVRRRPRPDAQIFVRREYPSEGYVRYLHFIGSSAERQIDVFTDKVLRFQKESETERDSQISQREFGETDWRAEEFISKKLFEQKWGQQDVPASVRFVETGDVFQFADVTSYAFEGNFRGEINRGPGEEFRKRFPEVIQRYTEACKRQEFDTDKILDFTYERGHIYALGLREVRNQNFVGERRRTLLLKHMAHVVNMMLDSAEVNHVPAIAMPAIGLELCQLTWDEVKVIVHDIVRFRHNVKVYVVRQLSSNTFSKSH